LGELVAAFTPFRPGFGHLEGDFALGTGKGAMYR
jgi:hypothetical protein